MPDVQPIPDSFPRITPHLTVTDVAGAIDFYTAVLGATERFRMPAPDGTVAHAEIQLGESVIMLGPGAPGGPETDPKTLGGSATSLYVYVEDVDAVVAQAEKAGGKIVQPLTDAFYGDRNAVIEDPYGQLWQIATHTEEVEPAEMMERFNKMMSEM